MANRLQYIDAIKGFAILLIVIGHVFLFGIGQVEGVSLFRISSTIQIPIFVFFSGYFTTRPPKLTWQGVMEYWQAKVVRLLLPMLFIPLLFHLLVNHGQIALPLRAWQGEYWFTISLFLLFGILYFVRIITSYLSKLLCDKHQDFVEMILLLLSVLVIEFVVVPRLATLGGAIIGSRVSNIHWLYKYFVLGHIVARSEKLQSWIKSHIGGAIAFVVFLFSAYDVLGEDEKYVLWGGG